MFKFLEKKPLWISLIGLLVIVLPIFFKLVEWDGFFYFFTGGVHGFVGTILILIGFFTEIDEEKAYHSNHEYDPDCDCRYCQYFL